MSFLNKRKEIDMKKQRVIFYFLTSVLLLFCAVILSLTKDAFAFTLPDTGQIKCYNTAGTEIACAGTGQDGAYNINPMSYTDNGNGTITDNVTGLIWQQGENVTNYNWYQASGTYNVTYNPSSQNVCGSLTLGGHSDWRLPVKKELITIVDYGIPYPGPVINTTYFPNTYAANYWSSTTYASNTSSAWLVDFSDGYGHSDDKSWSSRNYVRCVRGGQSASSFTDNGNGTVSDNVTGLMWQQGEPGSKTWSNALSYCEGLSLGGQTDWRLPNVKEMGSVTDDTKGNLSIYTTYFPNAYANVYWSSTTNTPYTNYAWYVYFLDGYIVNAGGKSGDVYYTRCVRGGQSGSSTVSGTLPVYRFYNTQAGFFMFTIYESEKDYILQNLPYYQNNGVSFYAYPTQQPGTLPVYRFYNTQAGFFMFTIYESEKNYILQNLPYYQNNGVSFYAYPTQQPGTLPVYRFYNTQAGFFMFTIYESEKDYILQNLPYYQLNGVSFYAYPNP